MRLIDPDELEKVLRPILTDESCPLHIAADIDMNIDLMPKVDAVPAIHGKWQTNRLDDAYYVCTVCKKATRIPRYVWWTYCPHCGAKMDGKGNGNEAD